MTTQTSISLSNDTHYKEVLDKIASDISEYTFDTTIDSMFTRSLLDAGYNGINFLKKPSEVKTWDEQEEKPFGQLGPRSNWWLDDFFCESKKRYYSISYTKNEDETFSVRILLVPSLDEYQKQQMNKETHDGVEDDVKLVIQAARFKSIAVEINLASEQLQRGLSRKACLSAQTEQAAVELKQALVNFRQVISKNEQPEKTPDEQPEKTPDEQPEKTDKTPDYKSFIRQLHNNFVEHITFSVPANSRLIHSLINDGYTQIAALGCTQDANGQPLNMDDDPVDTLTLEHIKVDDLYFSIKVALVGEETFNITVWMDLLV